MQRFDARRIAEPGSEFVRDVLEGLGATGQKVLPSKYLYDPLGTALFEAITLLPEYGLTRADERVLKTLAPALPGLLTGDVRIAELGSGAGTKTRFILEALGSGRPLDYHPIDVSAAAIERCRSELNGLCRVHAHQASYFDGLREAAAQRQDGDCLLVLFLGSTIGNFAYAEAGSFLREIRSILRPGDALLLGADLVKPVEILLSAYNDPTGVTTAFNKNLLGRINRELGGNFDLSAFTHESRYLVEDQAIEMHLRARRAQNATIAGAGIEVHLAEGESIRVGFSRKFTCEELDELAALAGFDPLRRWVDNQWPFAECLWLAP